MTSKKKEAEHDDTDFDLKARDYHRRQLNVDNVSTDTHYGMSDNMTVANIFKTLQVRRTDVLMIRYRD